MALKVYKNLFSKQKKDKHKYSIVYPYQLIERREESAVNGGMNRESARGEDGFSEIVNNGNHEKSLNISS